MASLTTLFTSLDVLASVSALDEAIELNAKNAAARLSEKGDM